MPEVNHYHVRFGPSFSSRPDVGSPSSRSFITRLTASYATLFFVADTVKNFLGNQTHNDHFKLLQSDGVSLLIGARNVVYNLSLATLEENTESVSKSIRLATLSA